MTSPRHAGLRPPLHLQATVDVHVPCALLFVSASHWGFPFFGGYLSPFFFFKKNSSGLTFLLLSELSNSAQENEKIFSKMPPNVSDDEPQRGHCLG